MKMVKVIDAIQLCVDVLIITYFLYHMPEYLGFK